MKLFFLFKPGKGQGMTEYAILIALVAIVVVAVVHLMGPKVGNTFSSINSSLDAIGAFNDGGFVHVANEGESFSVPAGAYEVQYGANGVYYTQFVNGPLTITCNATTFGDPLPGVPKSCNMRPAP
jgi:pilus assembly protein Flp/PilA